MPAKCFLLVYSQARARAERFHWLRMPATQESPGTNANHEHKAPFLGYTSRTHNSHASERKRIFYKSDNGSGGTAKQNPLSRLRRSNLKGLTLRPSTICWCFWKELFWNACSHQSCHHLYQWCQHCNLQLLKLLGPICQTLFPILNTK